MAVPAVIRRMPIPELRFFLTTNPENISSEAYLPASGRCAPLFVHQY